MWRKTIHNSLSVKNVIKIESMDYKEYIAYAVLDIQYKHKQITKTSEQLRLPSSTTDLVLIRLMHFENSVPI